jgi:hypothetical protein
LRKKRLVKYDELKEQAKNYVRGGEILFLPTLNFLYLLGTVEYRQKNDSFEYTGQ